MLDNQVECPMCASDKVSCLGMDDIDEICKCKKCDYVGYLMEFLTD